MLKRNMADVCETTDWVNGKIQAIRRLCKLSGNFHSSAVLLCLCVQEESHGGRMPRPPLAELAPPPSPPLAAPHQLVFGRAGDEPVGVGAREPGALSRAGLDRVVPGVPGPGWLEDGPWRLLLRRAALSHEAWDKAGADLLSDRWRETERTPRSGRWTQLLGLDVTQGRCYVDAVCLAASTAVMSVSWAVCGLIIHACTDCTEGKMQEKKGAGDFVAGLHCCLFKKWRGSA